MFISTEFCAVDYDWHQVEDTFTSLIAICFKVLVIMSYKVAINCKILMFIFFCWLHQGESKQLFLLAAFVNTKYFKILFIVTKFHMVVVLYICNVRKLTVFRSTSTFCIYLLQEVALHHGCLLAMKPLMPIRVQLHSWRKKNRCKRVCALIVMHFTHNVC